VLRRPRTADAPALAARRSEPEVARLQSWQAPYPIEAATALVEAVATEAGPVPDS
jgi:hypothetical protein